MADLANFYGALYKKTKVKVNSIYLVYFLMLTRQVPILDEYYPFYWPSGSCLKKTTYYSGAVFSAKSNLSNFTAAAD